MREEVEGRAADVSPDVLLQVAVAARKIAGLDAVPLLHAVALVCKDDPLIPRIVWRNSFLPLANPDNARRFADLIEATNLDLAPGLVALLPHAVDRLSSLPDLSGAPVRRLVKALLDADTPEGPRSGQGRP